MPTTIRRDEIFDALCNAVDAIRALNNPGKAYSIVEGAARIKRLERIDTAWDWILRQEIFTLEGDTLLIPSQSRPGIVYRVNRWCDCPSAAHVGCWHIEAASLIGRAQRYNQINRNRPAEAVPFCERPSRRQLVDWGNKSAQELTDELYA